MLGQRWRSKTKSPSLFEPPYDKTKKMVCALKEDSDQPRHPPSLIRVFAVRMKKAWVLSYPLRTQRRLIRLGGCPDWSEFFAGCTLILLVLSWGGSLVFLVSGICIPIWTLFFHCEYWTQMHESRHEKTCLCHVRTTKAQISRCIHAVWSMPCCSLLR